MSDITVSAPLLQSDIEADLTRLFQKGGRYVLRSCSDCLTADPMAAAKRAGLRVLTVSLLDAVTAGDIARIIENAKATANGFGHDSAFVLLVLDADAPLIAATSHEETLAVRTAVASGLSELLAFNPQTALVLSLFDPLFSVTAGLIDFDRLTGTELGLRLTRLSEADAALQYGDAMAEICVRSGMVPDLLAMELRDRYGNAGTFMRPHLEAWQSAGGAYWPLFVPAVIRTESATNCLLSAGYLLSDAFGRTHHFAAEDASPKRMAAELLVTTGLFLCETECGERFYKPANRSSVTALACMTLAQMLKADAEWTMHARELAKALWNDDPNATVDAVGALFDAVEDEDADIDCARFLATALAAIDVEVTVKADPERISVRLPGGVRELVLVGPEEEPTQFGSADVPRIVLSLG